MSVTKGKSGKVYVGANVVAEIQGFSFTRNAARAERSTLDDEWDRSDTVTKSWSGQMTVWWDPSDANGQMGLEEGDAAALKLYPDGNANGKTYYYGDVIVDSVEIGNERANHVTATIQFTGSGACTKAVVGA